MWKSTISVQNSHYVNRIISKPAKLHISCLKKAFDLSGSLPLFVPCSSFPSVLWMWMNLEESSCYTAGSFWGRGFGGSADKLPWTLKITQDKASYPTDSEKLSVLFCFLTHILFFDKQIAQLLCTLPLPSLSFSSPSSSSSSVNLCLVSACMWRWTRAARPQGTRVEKWKGMERTESPSGRRAQTRFTSKGKNTGVWFLSSSLSRNTPALLLLSSATLVVLGIWEKNKDTNQINCMRL